MRCPTNEVPYACGDAAVTAEFARLPSCYAAARRLGTARAANGGSHSLTKVWATVRLLTGSVLRALFRLALEMLGRLVTWWRSNVYAAQGGEARQGGGRGELPASPTGSL